MTKTILMDEFRIAVLAQRGLGGPSYRGIRRTLDSRRFFSVLRHALSQSFSRVSFTFIVDVLHASNSPLATITALPLR